MLILFVGVNLIMRVNRKLVFRIIWVEGFYTIRLNSFL